MRTFRIVCFLIVVLWGNNSFAERFLRAYTAEWCAPCQEFKREALTHPELTAGYTLEIIDTGNDAELQKIKRITTFPTFIIDDTDGEKEQEISRKVGYRPAEFREWLRAHRVKSALH